MNNNKYKILVIEDENNIRTFITALLEANNYQAIAADSCSNGQLMFKSHRPDLVILDLGLPDCDGTEFIRNIRTENTTPVIVLSARTDEKDKVEALDLGAKPAKAMRKVIFPEIMPGILSGFLLTVTLSLDDYIITAFTKNPSFVTLSTYVYGITAKKGALPPMLRALTTIIFLATLLVLLFVNIYNKKHNKKRGGLVK